MTYLIPRFILQKYQAQETNGRFATIALFVDISGFSVITSALMIQGNETVELMAEIMLDTFTPFVEAVYAQNGFITTFAGDGFIALFPVDQTTEKSVRSEQRALLAAFAIQQHMLANQVRETPYGRFPFSVKIGMGTGEVEWGILAPESDTSLNREHPEQLVAAYYFSGTAVDDAATAEHQAKPGNIILSPAVSADFQPDFPTIPVGDNGYQRILPVDIGQLPQLPSVPDNPDPGLLTQQTNFIPPAILNHLEQGEFRQVVTVFVNLMGIQTGRDLAPFITSIFELQKLYGGHLGRVDFGDKGCNLVMFWGMPTSTEQDIDNALHFIYELGNYTPGTYRAGATYRPMYAGLAGSVQRGEYTAYGNGINMAARLMMEAEWGHIWVDERIANRASNQFSLKKLGEFPLKGFTNPQPVYELVERQSIFLNTFFAGEMVGRQSEMERLHTFVQPLFAIDPELTRFAGILSVEGEAGLGKSRLVAEFLKNLAEPTDETTLSVQYFYAQTDQTINEALQPFRYWLHNYFEQSSIHSASRNKRAFGRRLDQLIAATADKELQQTLQRGRTFLGALIGLFWENSPFADLTPEGRHEWTASTLKALLKAESLRQPVILVLEDAHWLDQESVAFTERFVRQMAPYPLAIIATARPTVGDKPLFGEVDYDRLYLQIMSAEEVEQVGTAVLGGSLASPLTDLLIQRTEGNPFFAEQILLYLREEEQLTQTDGLWSLAANQSAHSLLPSDVRAIFIARLDRLTDEVKQVVQTAAILGREFEIQVLARMLQNDETLPDKLAHASEEAIWTPLNQMRYLFKHGLLRDAAYEMQLLARRRELHLLAAQTLEKLYAHDLDSQVKEIATHYEAAYQQGLEEAKTAARDYLEKAANQAVEQFENDSAIDYFNRTLTLLPPTDDEARFELLLKLEQIYFRQSNWEAELAVLEQLEAIANQRQFPGEMGRVVLIKLRIYNAIGLNSDFPQLIPEAIALSQSAQDIGLEAEARIWVAAFFWIMGESLGKAIAECQQAVTLARLAQNKSVEIEALGLQGYIVAIENKTEGIKLIQEALTMVRQNPYPGSEGSEAHILQYLITVMVWHNLLTEAKMYSEACLTLTREIGFRAFVIGTLYNLGDIYRLQGDYQQARAYYQQALQAAQEIRSTDLMLIAYNRLILISPYLNNTEDAFFFAEQAQLLLPQTDTLQHGPYHFALGNCYLWLSRFSEAEASYRQAVPARVLPFQPELTLEYRTRLARALLAQNKITEAREAIAGVIPYLERRALFDQAHEPLSIYWTCAQVLQAAGDAERARTTLETGYTLLQAQAQNITDESMRQAFLENVPYHRAIITAYQGQTIPATSVVDTLETAVEQIVPIPETSSALTPEEGKPEDVVTPTAVPTTTTKPRKSKSRKAKKRKKRRKKRPSVVIHINIHNYGDIHVINHDLEDNEDV